MVVVLGYAATTVTTVTFLPQVYKIVKTRQTKGVSMMSYLLLTLGGLLWMAYGFFNNDKPLLITNIIVFVCGIAVVFLKWRNETKRVK